ncbi:MAG: Hsp20/alpha crystallin family protein [Candidatus Magasanikbacteria bacterium]|nr:Hsp20/alpha crystallin family protein [Candidatus Magasanikbacteria bacterium]
MLENKTDIFGIMVGSKPTNQDWQESRQEGELAVDVIETENKIVIISTIAGTKTDSVEIYVHNDLLTVKGSREMPVEELSDGKMHLNECFWGAFSRTIVLPVDVQGHRAQAEYKNGILKITIPKQITDTKIPVFVVEE